MKKLMSLDSLARKLKNAASEAVYPQNSILLNLSRDIAGLHNFAMSPRRLNKRIRVRKTIEMGDHFGALIIIETDYGSAILPTSVEFPPYYGGSLKTYINEGKVGVFEKRAHYGELREANMKKGFHKLASLDTDSSAYRRTMERLFLVE